VYWKVQTDTIILVNINIKNMAMVRINLYRGQLPSAPIVSVSSRLLWVDGIRRSRYEAVAEEELF
jgi:hypothetical protein